MYIHILAGMLGGEPSKLMRHLRSTDEIPTLRHATRKHQTHTHSDRVPTLAAIMGRGGCHLRS